MAPSSTPAARQLKLLWSRLSEFAPVLGALAVALVLLRGYEGLLIVGEHALPGGAWTSFLYGVLFELAVAALLGGVLLVPFLAARPLGRRMALSVAAGGGAVVLLGAVALIQYFGITLLPLGTDAFAYSLADMAATVQTSVDITAAVLVPYLLVAIGFPGAVYALARALRSTEPEARPAMGVGVAAWIGGGALFYALAAPGSDAFEQPVHRHVFTNKLVHFAGAVWSSERADPVRPYEGPEYPLLRPADAPDVLAPYLKTGGELPNVVILMVEGLSSTFVGPNARWGGFTPYLDSLQQEGLYWPHALSTSGRSFNVVPSLFGSLPYGERGFLDLGFRMPAHHSLIEILEANGYHTTFYSGYDAAFDNVNLFLERQGIDRIVDRSDFGPQYRPMDDDQQGFTWGYADKDLMRRVSAHLDAEPARRPRLDMVFTVNFHEPFVIPEQERYLQRVHRRIDALQVSDEQKAAFRTYEEIFAALLYTDEAIRLLMDRYRQRPDYEQTLFVITGDHRIAPIPHATAFSRYRVPLLLFSPQIRTPQRFPSVASHLQVTPTLLAHLTAQYDLSQPDSVHWMGGVLNTDSTFGSDVSLPLMRNKNQLVDYVDGTRALAGDQAYTIRDGFRLERAGAAVAADLQAKLRNFKRMNRYVMQNDRLIRGAGQSPAERSQVQQEDSLLAALGLEAATVVDLFGHARQRAFDQEYREARILLRRTLRRAPDYHDARLLHGRTYGWSGDYDRAEQAFDEVLRRDSTTIGAYVALADLNYWRGNPQATIRWATTGLSHHAGSPRLQFRLARAHAQKDHVERARSLLRQLLEAHPDHQDAQALLARLER